MICLINKLEQKIQNVLNFYNLKLFICCKDISFTKKLNNSIKDFLFANKHFLNIVLKNLI